jgi:monoterpene epsilon-lactone hydrolase
MNNIAMIGDSAGGGITLGSILKMHDSGIGVPAAIVVFSPNTDLTLNGDTLFTLKDADPILNVSSIKNPIAAYADPSDHKIPYASPIDGNFSKGFPPTLIQVGTKEYFLVTLSVYIKHWIKQAYQ